MSFSIVRYAYTLWYLRPEQLFFQVYYRLCALAKKSMRWSLPLHCNRKGKLLHLLDGIPAGNSFMDGRWTFLNISIRFDDSRTDWNFQDYGKLWAYNLTYFDCLCQPGMNKERGLALINSFIDQLQPQSVGFEPYPTSLRGINWIKFLSQNEARDHQVDGSLYAQYVILERNIEYHLLGNHLLENAFSLLFGAVYFNERSWFEKSRKLLQRELKEQVLDDGGHFELSPMYHQILLDRLLDCVNLVKHNHRFAGQERLLGFMQERAGKMLGWLQSITFPDGSVPHVNDATDGIAPSSSEIEAYAHRLGISTPEREALADSGYRRFDRDAYCCIADVGAIGPDYIPGHAHADTFGFILHVHKKPLIVDTGISTYEKNEIRQRERSTNAHNTVVVNGRNSSDVWGGFRVGKRAKTVIEEDGKHVLSARHDGYRDQGVTHRRIWVFGDEDIEITDEVIGEIRLAETFLHFDYRVDVSNTDGALVADGVRIQFHGAEQVELADYEQALGFNKRQGARCVRVTFRDRLVTRIRM